MTSHADGTAEHNAIEDRELRADVQNELNEPLTGPVTAKPPPQLLRVQSLAPALETKPSNYLFLAIFTIFINPPVAIIALVIAIDADHQYLRGYTDKARRLGLVVKYTCIVGIIITAILIITLSSIYH